MSRWKLAFLTVILAVAASLSALPAMASPAPSLPQIRHKIAALQRRVNDLDQRYDAVLSQVTAAKDEVRATGRMVTSDRAQVHIMQNQVRQVAIYLYEQGDLQTPESLLTAGNAQKVLDQDSIAAELSSNDVTVVKQYQAELSRLGRTKQLAARYGRGASQLKAQARGIRHQMQALTNQVNALTGAFPAAAPPASTGQTGGYDPIPTSSAAGKAVSFVYAQLGCPYTWGGTGPCHSGFDCSGLVMQAWAYAGVSIPRTSEEQESGLPHIPPQDMAPGDLLIVLGGAHVGMYVGGGMVIDAPHTGAVVERVPFAGWWQANLDAVVRP